MGNNAPTLNNRSETVSNFENFSHQLNSSFTLLNDFIFDFNTSKNNVENARNLNAHFKNQLNHAEQLSVYLKEGSINSDYIIQSDFVKIRAGIEAIASVVHNLALFLDNRINHEEIHFYLCSNLKTINDICDYFAIRKKEIKHGKKIIQNKDAPSERFQSTQSGSKGGFNRDSLNSRSDIFYNLLSVSQNSIKSILDQLYIHQDLDIRVLNEPRLYLLNLDKVISKINTDDSIRLSNQDKATLNEFIPVLKNACYELDQFQNNHPKRKIIECLENYLNYIAKF